MYDLIIIGAGVVGCATARELSRYDLKIAVLEKEEDVSMGASKANSGIVHGGYDAKYGSLKGKLSAEGNRLFTKLDKELNFGINRCGSLVLAFSDEEEKTIENLYENGLKNGVMDLSIIDREEILRKEPNLNPNVKKALLCESAGVTSPYEYTVALAENAADNGVRFFFDSPVTSIKKENDTFKITTPSNIFEAKRVINATGVFSDEISKMIAPTDFTITPRRGEYMLLDKSEGKRVNKVIFQSPSNGTKGVLVAPTLHGNLIVGPSAEYIDDKDDTETTPDVLDRVWNTAMKSMPKLDKSKIITQFAGLRASSSRHDFIIEETQTKGFINAAGIESPGLSTSYAIALMLRDILSDSGIELKEKPTFNPNRRSFIKLENLSNEEINDLIKKDSSFGNVICRCETITEGQILDCLKRNIPPRSVDGVKRRIRAGMGRCQGGFCQPRVMEIIAKYQKREVEDITKKGKGSYILTGQTGKGLK